MATKFLSRLRSAFVFLCALLLAGNIVNPTLAIASGLPELKLDADPVAAEPWDSRYQFFEDFERALHNASEAEPELNITCIPVDDKNSGSTGIATSEINLQSFASSDAKTLRNKNHCAEVLDPETSPEADYAQPPGKMVVRRTVTSSSPLPKNSGSTTCSSTAAIITAVPTSPTDKFDLVSVEPNELYSSPTTNFAFDRFIFTFNEPVVSSSEVAKFQATNIPVIAKPSIQGRSYWFDPQTFIIEPKGKTLPAATSYEITTTSNLKSLSGEPLVKAHRIRYQSSRPEGSLGTIGPQKAFAVHFGQKVKPDSVLSALNVTSGGEKLSIRPATDQELHEIYQQSYVKKKLFAFYPLGYTFDNPINIELKPGIESEEGPLKSIGTRNLTITFRNPLNRSQQPQYSYEPGEPLEIDFPRPLNGAKIDISEIKIDPPVDKLRCSFKDRAIILQGDTKPNTTYKVSIPKGFASDDSEVAAEEHRNFVVGDYQPRLFPPGQKLLRIPTAQKSIQIRSINMKRIRIQVFNADGAPLNDYFFARENKEPVYETILEPTAELNAVASTPLDLREIDAKKLHSFWLKVEDADFEPSKLSREELIKRNLPSHPSGMARPRLCNKVLLAIQRTNLAMTLTPSDQLVSCFVVDWKTGEPVSNATIIGTSGVPDRYHPGPRSSRVDFDAIAERAKVKVSGVTDSNGICVFNFEANKKLSECNSFTVSANGDELRMSLNCGRPPTETSRYSWFVDSENYECIREQPVKIWGWVKGFDGKELTNLRTEGCTVTYTIKDSQSQILGSGQLPLTANGGFHGSYSLPSSTSCGEGTINYKLVDAHGTELSENTGCFTVAEEQEFFGGLVMRMDSQTILGKPNRIIARAKDRLGKDLPNRQLVWNIYSARIPYSPPGWSNFKFTQTSLTGARSYRWAQTKPLRTKTNSDGETAIDLKVTGSNTPLPAMLVAGTTEDVEGQQLRRSQAVQSVLHAPAYVGIKLDVKTSDGRKTLALSHITTDYRGQAVPGKFVRLRVSSLKRPFGEKRVAPDKAIWEKIAVSSTHIESEEIPITETGAMLVSADILDNFKADSKVVQSASIILNSPSLWTWSKDGLFVAVSSNKEEYAAGDDCTLSVKSPFKNAQGYVLIDTAYGIQTPVIPIAIHDYRGTVVAPLQRLTSAESPVALSGIIKLYETDLNSNLPVENSRSASQIFSIARRPQSKQLDIRVSVSDVVEVGEATSVNLQVHLPDGTPAANAECVVSVQPLTSFGEEYPRVLFNLPSESNPVRNSYSNDRFAEWGSKLNTGPEDYVERTVRDNLRLEGLPHATGILGAVCNQTTDSRMFFDRSTERLTLDDKGRGSTKLTIPQHAGNYRVVCTVIDSTNRGEKSMCIQAVEPISASCYVPSQVNEGDKFDLLINLENRTNSPKGVSIKLMTEATAYTDKITAEPGLTRVRLKAASAVPKLRVEVGSGAQSFSFDCAPHVVPGNNIITKRIRLTQNAEKAELLESPEWRLASIRTKVSTDSTALITSALTAMCEKRPDSTIEIAGRALAILQFHKLCAQSKRVELDAVYKSFEPLLREDICKLTKSYEQMRSGICWLPGSSNARNLQSPFLMAAHAISNANAAGISVSEQLLNRIATDAAMPRNGSNTLRGNLSKKEMAYFVYVTSIMDPSQMWVDEKYKAQQFEKFVQNFVIETISGEELNWLCLSLSTNLPIEESVKSRLTNRLRETAQDETILRDQKPTLEVDGIVYSSATTRDATKILALINSPLGARDIEKALERLASNLKNRGVTASWNGPIESALAVSALCEYEAWKNKQTRIPHAAFTDTSIPITINGTQIVAAENGDEAVLTAVFRRKAAVRRPALNTGIALKREFFATNEDSRVWRDSNGNWNCTRGSTLIEKLSFVPQGRIDKVVLLDQVAAGFGSIEPFMKQEHLFEGPTAFPSRAIYWAEAGEFWAQEIDRDGHNFRVYATAVGPALYEFKYKLDAALPGKFFMPAAEIKTVFSDKTVGISDSAFMTIHESDPRVPSPALK